MKYQPDHTAISTCNLEESMAFYAHFGFEECNRYADPDDQYVIVMMRLGEYQLEIFAFAENGDAAEENIAYGDKLKGLGVKHIALGVENLDDALKDLQEKGIANDASPITDGRLGRRYFFVKDPDGVWVEIIEQNVTF